LTAMQHIYVHRKSDYYELNDGLPQFDAEYPPFDADDTA